MPSLSPLAQAKLDEFARQPDVTPEHIANLQAVIAASPVLVDQINEAVARDNLRSFAILDASSAGAQYQPKERVIELKLATLTASGDGLPFNAGEATFVLAHELQHGFNREATAQALQAFANEARQEARSRDSEHDYTEIVGRRIAANRRDEAAAEIAGWNAVVSRVKHTINANPTLREIFDEAPGRMVDFIDRSKSQPPAYTLKSNLTPDPDLTLSPTAANIEAMGQNYFDKVPDKSRLGDKGKSDYATYYGVSAIERIVQYEHQYGRRGADPRLTLDMEELNLNEEWLEREGIDLGAYKQTPQPYYDSSQTPAVLRHFDHTQDGSVNPGYDHAYKPIAPSALPGRSQEEEAPELRAGQASLSSIPKSPFDDPYLDVMYHALMTDDDKLLDQVAEAFTRSPEGQRMIQLGDELYAEQQRQEALQQAQAQTQTQTQGPARSR